MKAIVATKEVLNEHGDIIRIVYHYEDGTKSEKQVFVPAAKVSK
ncbi:hypothetical protein ACFLR6_00190 [Campylobacterota bacterium]